MGYSDFLFARPSFTEGMARIFDFGNTLFEYNRSPTPQAADYNALLADYMQIGLDFHNVLDLFGAENPGVSFKKIKNSTKAIKEKVC